MRMSAGASPRRLPRLTAVLTTLLMVVLLVPWDVGAAARAQNPESASVQELRAQQSEAERAEQQARESQAGVASELQGAVEDRQAVETDLAQATAAVEEIRTDIDAVVDEQTALRTEIARLEGQAADTRRSLRAQIRALYMQGAADDLVLAFNADATTELGDRAHYLSALSRVDRGRLEQVDVITTTLAGRQAELVVVDERLAALRADAEGRRSELDRQLLLAAGVEEEVAGQLVAAEAQARQLAQAADQAQVRVGQAVEAERQAAIAAAAEAARQAAEAAAAAAAATAAATARANADAAAQAPSGVTAASSGSSDPAPVNASGKSCPQDNPRSFTDTWGAPRSGGRRHQGTDIFGTRGGNVFAITSGTVTRTSNGSLSGLFLLLRGDDGNDYWYIHLQDFVASVGQRVSVGELIAHNGDSGNARGTTPHIHFEYHPGGGGAVNPYPLLASIC
ncbi:MAG: murein hydrolase activator EnvC family protein [Euzebya sp.]